MVGLITHTQISYTTHIHTQRFAVPTCCSVTTSSWATPLTLSWWQSAKAHPSIPRPRKTTPNAAMKVHHHLPENLFVVVTMVNDMIETNNYCNSEIADIYRICRCMATSCYNFKWKRVVNWANPRSRYMFVFTAPEYTGDVASFQI